MLRFNHRLLYSFSLTALYPPRIGKMYTLKSLKYVRQEEYQLLAKRFEENRMHKDRIDYLNKLKSEGTLTSFYSNKEIKALKEEDIFYLLTCGIEYSLSKSGHKDLITQIETTYFKCLCAKEFDWLEMVSQFSIILSFNKEVLDMSPREMTFCLEVISDFQQTTNQLDTFRIKNKIAELVESGTHPNYMLRICGYLLKINIFFPTIIDAYLLQKWYVSHKSFQFQSIYFFHKLSEKLMIPVPQSKKSELNLILKTVMMKMQIKVFQKEYLLLLFKQYPQHVTTFNKLHFTPRAYIDYLRFFTQHQQYKLAQHFISHRVIQLTEYIEFKNIIELRMALFIDNVLSIAKNLHLYFSFSLKAVNCYINYLRETKVEDLEVFYIVQKIIAKKLKLNIETEQEFPPEFSIEETIVLLVNLERHKICSVDFWKKVVRKLQKLIQRNFENKIIQTRIEPYIDLLYIVSMKNFKEETRDFVYNQIEALLRDFNVLWSLNNYLKLIKVLDTAKIGEMQIWILIQIRMEETLNKLKAEELAAQHNQIILLKLAISFSYMNKGSYKFWYLLDSKLQNETKKKVLLRFKNKDSLAQTYLKTKDSSLP